MATNGEKTSGPKRVRRTSAKTDAPEVATLPDEDVVVRSGEPQSPGLWSVLTSYLFATGQPRHADVTNFLRQFIMLVEAGTSILKALKTLSKRGGTPAIRALVGDIAEYVETGNPLWQSFDRHPRYFDSIFVNLLRASEASGTLVEVMRRLTVFREQRELLRKRVRGAMVYPVLLIVACFGVMLLLTNFVVPAFEDMFTRAHLEMPDLTASFIWWSGIFRVWWWVPIVGLVLLALVYQVWWIRSPLRRLIADRIKLRIPIAGPIVHKNALVEMTRTLAMLLRSGLSMRAALELTRGAIHNRAVAQSLQGVRDSIEQGGGLETPLREASDVIPDVVTDMFVTGEESGRVDAVSEQMADIYEEEVSIAVNSLGEAIQPIFTIIVGVAVIILFVALFLPLVTMIDQLSGGV